MTSDKAPPPQPGPSMDVVMVNVGDRRDAVLAEPPATSPGDVAWRDHVRAEQRRAELEALGVELDGAVQFEHGLAAAVATLRAQADEVERALGPASARRVRDQADDIEARRERTASRVTQIRDRITWRKKN
jgi:hypothetical protein